MTSQVSVSLSDRFVSLVSSVLRVNAAKGVVDLEKGTHGFPLGILRSRKIRVARKSARSLYLFDPHEKEISPKCKKGSGY